VRDTVKRAADPDGPAGHMPWVQIWETVPRKDLWLAQTPQVFRRDLILARFHGRDVVIPIEEEVDSIVLPVIVEPLIPPVVDSMLQDTLHVRTDTADDSLRDTTRDTTRDTVRRVSRRGAAASPRP